MNSEAGSILSHADAAKERAAQERDAARFQYLQNIPVLYAQAFFWNHSSRKQRAATIDAAMLKEGK